MYKIEFAVHSQLDSNFICRMNPIPIRDTEVNVQAIIQLSAGRTDFKEDVGQFYDKWAEHYDQGLENSKYVAPVGGVEELSKRVEDKSALIVDCAAGTGQVGVELAKHGFKNIDAVDLSQKSLDISASKGVYRKLICDSLGKNKIKGVEDGCYDALTCIGAVGVGHISEDAFVEWNRIVKKGGIIVFSAGRVSFENESQEQKDVKNRIRAAIKDLVEKRQWEMLDHKEMDYLFGHSADMFTVRRL